MPSIHIYGLTLPLVSAELDPADGKAEEDWGSQRDRILNVRRWRQEWRALVEQVVALAGEHGWECTGSQGWDESTPSHMTEAAIVLVLRYPDVTNIPTWQRMTLVSGLNFLDSSRRLFMYRTEAEPAKIVSYLPSGPLECFQDIVGDHRLCMQEIETRMLGYRSEQFEALTGLASEESFASSINAHLSKQAVGIEVGIVTVECVSRMADPNLELQVLRAVAAGVHSFALQHIAVCALGNEGVSRLHSGRFAIYLTSCDSAHSYARYCLNHVKQQLASLPLTLAQADFQLLLVARIVRFPDGLANSEHLLNETGIAVNEQFWPWHGDYS
jgi:hypothetical protein